MKKRMIAAVALVAMLSVTLSSCGGGNKDAKPPVSDSPAQQLDEAEAPADSVAQDSTVIVNGPEETDSLAAGEGE